jgi:hypothetical protein
MASRRIGAETVSVTSVNFPGHAPDRQSSDLRIMNRIRVGAVNDYRPDLRRAEGEIAPMPARRSVSNSQVTLILRSSPEPQLEIGARAFRTPAPIRFRPSTKLPGGLCLPSGRGLLVPRGRAIALLEAGAAAGVASFLEGRREVVAAAIWHTSFSAADTVRDDRGEAFAVFAERAAFGLAPTARFFTGATDLWLGSTDAPDMGSASVFM